VRERNRHCLTSPTLTMGTKKVSDTTDVDWYVVAESPKYFGEFVKVKRKTSKKCEMRKAR
jgi:hypothetical protein